MTSSTIQTKDPTITVVMYYNRKFDENATDLMEMVMSVNLDSTAFRVDYIGKRNANETRCQFTCTETEFKRIFGMLEAHDFGDWNSISIN
jgi:hypothetical protein